MKYGIIYTLLFCVLNFPNIIYSQCNVQGGTLSGGPFQFCVGDAIVDTIPAGSITLNGNTGPNSQWVVTDSLANILALPTMPTLVDFDGADLGSCFIWHLSYEDGLAGAELGMSAQDLQGCFSLSNPISVIREDCCKVDLCSSPDFMDLDGTTNAEFDINNSNILIGSAQMSLTRTFNGSAVPDENQINATQTDGDIGVRLGVEDAIGLANNMTASYKFSDAVCNLDFDIWDIDQSDEIIVEAYNNGIAVNYSTSTGSCVLQLANSFIPNGDLCEIQVDGETNHRAVISINGCIDELRIISYDQGDGDGGSYTTVFNEGCNSSDISGGSLTGGPFNFCVSDGQPDNIAAASIALSGNVGSNSAWVVTDDLGNILGLPTMLSEVDFDIAGVGTCLVWHLSFEDDLMGAVVGMNANDLTGCYSLSNPISIERRICCTQAVCSIPNIASFDGNSNAETSINNNNITIGNAVLMLDRITNGTAQLDENVIDNSQTSGDIGVRLGVSDAIGANNNMITSFSLSEPVCKFSFDIWDIDQTDQIVVEAFNAGTPVPYTSIEGSCVARNSNDFIPAGPACENQVNGDSTHMVSITVNSCITEIRITSFDQGGGDGGSYTIVLNEGCTNVVKGGTLVGGPFEFCVGDGLADNIPIGSITLGGNTGSNSAWVVTDNLGNILGFPTSPSAVDFDDAEADTCLVWNLSFEFGLLGAEVGMNANELNGCYSLSNPISVIRNDCGPNCMVSGGTLTGGPYEFCVGDGIADNIPEGSITLSENIGSNNAWMTTDNSGNILGFPFTPSSVDFDGAGVDTCLLWNLSFEFGLLGAEVGKNINELNGCYNLSNPISIFRNEAGPACQSDCFVAQQIDNIPIIAGLYEASDNINSKGSVSAGAVEFTAGICIELESNFEVVSGNEFQAYIEGCDKE